VTSQHVDLPLCHGTSVRPSGRFPSVRNNPEGSFVTGTPAEAKERVIKLFRACHHGALLTCPELFYNQNCVAHGHRRGNRSGIDVAHRGLSQASSPLQLSPPHHQVLNLMRRWAWRTTSLHCVAWNQQETKPEGVWSSDWLPPAPCPQAHQSYPRKAVLLLCYYYYYCYYFSKCKDYSDAIVQTLQGHFTIVTELQRDSIVNSMLS